MLKLKGLIFLFDFKGKKGVFHKVALHSRKLANLVKQCRDIPGKRTFSIL